MTLSKRKPETAQRENVITFLASLPPIKSAILLDGNGDGGQIKLEFARDESDKILMVQHLFAGMAFRVTIEPE